MKRRKEKLGSRDHRKWNSINYMNISNKEAATIQLLRWVIFVSFKLSSLFSSPFSHISLNHPCEVGNHDILKKYMKGHIRLTWYSFLQFLFAVNVSLKYCFRYSTKKSPPPPKKKTSLVKISVFCSRQKWKDPVVINLWVQFSEYIFQVTAVRQTKLKWVYMHVCFILFYVKRACPGLGPNWQKSFRRVINFNTSFSW